MDVRPLALAALILGLLVPAAPAQEPPGPAGQESLVNLEHVWNFQTTGTPSNTRATDLEYYTPTVPLRDRETGEKVLDEEGNEILVERDFAVMGSYDGGAWVFDITDPEDPFFVDNIPCLQRQNDVQIKRFGERWLLALARDGTGNPCVTERLIGPPGHGGIAVFDISDPYEVQGLYGFRNPSGAHNFTFHPTEPYGYISVGDITGLSATGYRAVIPIIDFTDPDNPRLADEIDLIGSPHDIVFSPDGERAYVAAENNWQIYDTTDPERPVLLNDPPMPNAGTYAHGFDPTPDRQLAIGTNESLALGGFFVGGTAVCPGEGLTFFDVSDEANPTPVGQYVAPVVGNPSGSRNCTGHVGRIAPNGRVMVTGWYAGGSRVIDFSDPTFPRELGHAVMGDGSVWTANFYKGPYLYAADRNRGFDVFRWTGEGPAPWEAP